MRVLFLIALLLLATIAPARADTDAPPCVALPLLSYQAGPGAVTPTFPGPPAACTRYYRSEEAGDVRTIEISEGSSARSLSLTWLRLGVRVETVELHRGLCCVPASSTDAWPPADVLIVAEYSGALAFGTSTYAWPRSGSGYLVLLPGVLR